MNDIKKILNLEKEEKYKSFASSLIPGMRKDFMLGVRIPKLRKIADGILKDNPLNFLENFDEDKFEYIMLKGMVIAKTELPLREKLALTERFVKKIDNWSVCDSFCSSFKLKPCEKERMREFLLPYFKKEGEFEGRFAVVMLINHYNEEKYIKENLMLIENTANTDFYCEMAKAWALEEFYALSKEEVYKFLLADNLTDFTHNKAITKINESLKITSEDKEKIKTLKRGQNVNCG